MGPSVETIDDVDSLHDHHVPVDLGVESGDFTMVDENGASTGCRPCVGEKKAFGVDVQRVVIGETPLKEFRIEPRHTPQEVVTTQPTRSRDT